MYYLLHITVKNRMYCLQNRRGYLSRCIFPYTLSFRPNNFCSWVFALSGDLQNHGLWFGKLPAGKENMYELRRFLKLGTYFLHFINCLFTESNFSTHLIECVNHLSTTTIKATSNCQCKFLKQTRINCHFFFDKPRIKIFTR